MEIVSHNILRPDDMDTDKEIKSFPKALSNAYYTWITKHVFSLLMPTLPTQILNAFSAGRLHALDSFCRELI